MIWLSSVRRNTSRPSRAHAGVKPPSFEICHLRPWSGDDLTYTWKLPDSFDE